MGTSRWWGSRCRIAAELGSCPPRHMPGSLGRALRCIGATAPGSTLALGFTDASVTGRRDGRAEVQLERVAGRYIGPTALEPALMRDLADLSVQRISAMLHAWPREARTAAALPGRRP